MFLPQAYESFKEKELFILNVAVLLHDISMSETFSVRRQIIDNAAELDRLLHGIETADTALRSSSISRDSCAVSTLSPISGSSSCTH